MPLPENFDAAEHLLNTFSQVHNRFVREEFSDVDDDGISTPRSSLRTASLIRDDDSIIMTLLKCWLFYVMVRKASDFHPALYAQPALNLEAQVRYRPQVTLFFNQDISSTMEDGIRAEGRISFRLRNETSQTITESELRSLANQIKSRFASGGGYRWNKGKNLYTYKDLEQGFNFQILAINESEARQLMRDVISLNDGTFKDDLFVSHLPEANFPSNQGSTVILGRSRKNPVRRPTALVRFRYAVCHINGLPNPITLIDLTGFRRDALVSAF